MYYWLEAEVAGGFGDGIDYRYDRIPRVLPPMRYEFQGWDGGCIVTTSPVWIVTDRLAHELRAQEATGLAFAGKVIVTRDPQWAQTRPDVQLPEWEWILPQGVAHRDDFWLKGGTSLAVSERVLALIKELGIGSGMEFSEDACPDGPPRLDMQALRAEYRRRGFTRLSDPRAAWQASLNAPRPQASGVEKMDLTQHPETMVTLRPNTKYEMALPGGCEADCYTDRTGQVRYIETVRGTPVVPNIVLEDYRPNTAYIVHSVDGLYAIILRTDAQSRLIEIAADPLAPAGTFGPGGQPFVALFGAWYGQVNPHALLATAKGSAADDLTAMAQWLVEETGNRQSASVRVQASYVDAEIIPSQFQVDYMVDGQSVSRTLPNA